ncbi:MAG: YgaP family membrane protein [Mycobacterium sp.]
MTNNPIERTAFGMPRPQGWPLERIVGLMAGTVVLVSLTLGRRHSDRWRILTGLAGANLMLSAVAGWCPMSVVLHRLGVSTATERGHRM